MAKAPTQSFLQEKAKAEAIFASIGEGMIATDEHGRINGINEIALDILGYNLETALGKWFPDIVAAIYEDGSLMANMDRPMARAVLTGTTIREHLIYLNTYGRAIPVSIIASPIFLRGKPIGAIQIFHDNSVELKTEKLKTEFISVAAHQLRTPLTAINLYSHMLYDGYGGELNEDQKKLITTVSSATERMNHLISTLLNITRIEAGTISVEPKQVSISQLVQEIVTEISPQAQAKKIRINYELPADTLVLNTDSNLVKEVVANLLSNAVKYTPEGGTIHTSARLTDSEIIIRIEDTGYGIPAESQPYIFTKFFRAGNIIAHDVSGTGLGLYLTKIIVKNLDGDIWFKSQENKGTIFYLSLPIAGSPSKVGKFRIGADE